MNDRQSIMGVALVAAMLGSVFTFAWVRVLEPRPSVAQTVAEAGVMDSHAVERAAALIGPSVVNIDTQAPQATNNPHGQDFMRHFFGDHPPEETPDREKGVGSGVIVSADGY